MTTDNVSGSDEREPIRYYVDMGGEGGSSVSLLISDRRDFLSQQHDTLEEAASADPALLIDQIAGQSAGTPDYLLPDTPLKEAVFRVLLANSNEPMSAAQVSEELKKRWTMSAYPRDLSPSVMERLLQSMASYSVAGIFPPEPVAETETPASKPEIAGGEGGNSNDE